MSADFSVLQLVVTLLVIAGLIGGGVFLWHYSGWRRTHKPPEPPPS